MVSKKTTAFVWDYLYDKTGREQFRRPPTVTKLVEKGRLGAISGQGLYKFEEDYATIVSSRDNQLKSLLDWLRANDRMAEFKLAEDKS